MAVLETLNGVITVRVVYYGVPSAGKTTNLELIWPLIHGTESGRLLPRLVGENRVASLDIPSGALARLMGSNVLARLETIQGEVSGSGGGWSSLLAEADGIVFVADSSPHARTANVKALAGLRAHLEGAGRPAGAIPVVMQWNKRDRDDARPIAELETELNHRCFKSFAATSVRGVGVRETFIAILARTVNAALRKAGSTTVAESELEQTLEAALQRLSRSARTAANERFGATIERQTTDGPEVREPVRSSRDVYGARSGEAVYSGDLTDEETLAIVARGDADPHAVVDAAPRMLAALERAASALDERDANGLPPRWMAGLLAGCDRTHGSLLLYRQGTPRMEECEVVPAGNDPLNSPQRTTGATKAATFCAGHEPVFIGHLADEIVLGAVSQGTEQLQAALIVPLVFGSRTFGGVVVYVTRRQRPPIAAEHAYWKTAAALASMHLAWQAAKDRPVASRRTERRPGLTTAKPLDS